MNWEIVWRDHWREIFIFIRSRVRNKYDAEDLTQETFTRAMNAWSKRQVSLSKDIAFLKTIARNLIIDKYRKDSRTYPAIPLEEAWMQNEWTKSDDVFQQVDQMMELQEEFAKLSERKQQVLQYRLVQDLSVKETANLLQMSESAVKTIQFRTIKQLKEQLLQCGQVVL